MKDGSQVRGGWGSRYGSGGRSGRGGKGAGRQSGNHFFVLWASLVVILLAFFILLNSISNIDVLKQQKVSRSLSTSFGMVRGVDRLDLGLSVPSPSPLVPIEGSARFQKAVRGLTEYVDREQLTDQVQLGTRGDHLVLILADTVAFASGEVELVAEALPLLDEIAKLIDASYGIVTIEGHTDSSPSSNAFYSSNWEVSMARAVSILQYLVEKSPRLAKRLEGAGYADHRPAAPDDTEEGRAKNRRVEFVFQERGEQL